MASVLHGSARTTPRLRAEFQANRIAGLAGGETLVSMLGEIEGPDFADRLLRQR